MAQKVYPEGNHIVFLDTVTGRRSQIPQQDIEIIQSVEDATTYKIYRKGKIINHAFDLTGVQNELGTVYTETSFEHLIKNHTGGGGIMDVFNQGEDTKFFVTPARTSEATTTTTVLAAIDDKTITVDDATGIVIGDFFLMYSTVANRVMQGHVTSINALVIGVRDPLDFAYPIGTIVEFGSEDMAVNGLVTPVVFKYKWGLTVMPIKIHITNIVFTIEMTTAPDFSKFGDITGGLLFGVSLRKDDGVKVNLLNFRTNADFAKVGARYTEHAAKGNAPETLEAHIDLQQLGVIIELLQNDEIEVTVQDDLSSLEKLTCAFIGHRA